MSHSTQTYVGSSGKAANTLTTLLPLQASKKTNKQKKQKQKNKTTTTTATTKPYAFIYNGRTVIFLVDLVCTVHHRPLGLNPGSPVGGDVWEGIESESQSHTVT